MTATAGAGALQAARAAEARAAAELAAALGPAWTVLRPGVLACNGEARELDLVAVGPGGVVTVEVKHWPAAVAIGPDSAAVYKEWTWLARRSPVAQAAAQRRLLAAWLAQRGLPAPVLAVVLLPHTTSVAVDPALLFAAEVTVCWGGGAAAYLAERLRAFPPALTAARRDAIVRALSAPA